MRCRGWRPSGTILARLLVQAAAGSLGVVAGGRLIRLVDATTVRKAGKSARENGRLSRTHAVFDLPTERFSAFELSDEKGAERINRMKVIRHGGAMLRMDASCASPTAFIAAPTNWPM